MHIGRKGKGFGPESSQNHFCILPTVLSMEIYYEIAEFFNELSVDLDVGGKGGGNDYV